MWYLIIPPIIVIASLVLLIWFLSKQSEQASIQERMADMANHNSFREWQTLRLKQVFFRFLEKLTRSLKVFSLRIHNLFHTLGQSFHERRHQSDLLVTSLLNLKKEKEGGAEDNSVFTTTKPMVTDANVKSPSYAESPEEETERVVEQPLIPRRSDASTATRPMVSERVVIPETKPNTVIARDLKEEERLIKKIAANPKNISAYEALGDYYLDRGDVNDAKACYRQVLKLSPVHRMVKVKIRKLERMMEEQKTE